MIHVRFDESDFQTSGLVAAINRTIDVEAARLGVAVGYGFRFRELIRAVAATHPSGRLVVLVDEYDKPIINYLNDPARARERTATS